VKPPRGRSAKKRSVLETRASRLGPVIEEAGFAFMSGRVMSKICVSATDNSLDDQVDPRFGRCMYFLIVDTDTMQYCSLRNSAADSQLGTGIQAAQTAAIEVQGLCPVMDTCLFLNADISTLP